MGRSRSSLLPRGSTPSGLVAPSWLPSPPSRRCGSPSRSSTRLDPESSTANASKSTENAFRLRQFSLRCRPSGIVMFYEYRFVFYLFFFYNFINFMNFINSINFSYEFFHHEMTISLTLDDFTRFPL